jgi:outer membrane protein TolC
MKFRLSLLFFVAVPFAAAQQTLELSLRKAIEIALSPEGNARVEIAGEAVQQAEARKLQARASLLPNLDSSLSYQDATRNLAAFGIQFPSIPGFHFSTFAGPFSILDARTNITQSVFDFSSIRRYQSARTGVDAARSEKENTRNAVTDQVARAYLAALQADAHVETAKANLDLAEALRRLAETQKTAGTGTGIEVTRAEVQIANERQRLQIAENERNRTHLQLLRALDLNLGTKVELTDKLSYQPFEPISFAQALESAIRTRPDLKAQQEREQAARLSYTAAKMERLPSLAAFGDYGSIGPQFDNSRPTRTVGLSLRVPIFDGGRRDARRAESASQWRQEKVRTKDLRQQLELELRVAFDNLSSAELQVKTATEGLTLAERELEQAERRYKAGVTNSIEVTDAQTRLVRARDNRISALFQHNLARLDLGTAIGAVERYLP